VRLGATLVHLSPGPPYPTAEWARQLVDVGFDSLWVPQVIGRPGMFVPDPFVTLAIAATATEDVELGTATVQVPLHHPAELAHRVLSLAQACGNRLTLGVSPGSTAADYRALDRNHAGRFAAFDRDVARLRTLLADGRDGDAEIVPVALAPGRAHRPPMLLGSWGANVVKAAEDFDGWLAAASRRTPEQIIQAHRRFRAAGGRRAVVCSVRVATSADLGPSGEALRRFEEAGFDDAVVVLGPGGPSPAQVRALLPR
jgi:alkanesulfonate monooxygenase SsuD/methylene tetrahydromethanopterin reductase-like flavin-dependent oxidoreductase (luciferase family)